jgi:hypothetical protein
MLFWSTYKNAYVGISTCAFGYYKLATSVLSSILKSFIVEGVRTYDHLAVNKSLPVDIKLDYLAKESPSFNYYHRAMGELVKVLNIHVVSRLRRC